MFKKTTLLSAGLLAVLLFASARGADPADKPAGSEDLDAAIKKGVEMLEAKKTDEFLDRYILPSDLAQAKKSGHWDDIVAEFKSSHTEVMLKVLKAVQDMKPELTEDGALATYDVSKVEGRHPPKAHFRKIKDVWYIADK